MRASALSLSAQAIAAAEEEAAKKKVGSAAALKQLDKLRKEAVKSTSEADKIFEELVARKQEHKVRNALMDHRLAKHFRHDQRTVNVLPSNHVNATCVLSASEAVAVHLRRCQLSPRRAWTTRPSRC